jgi:2-oxoisovalerate dehydrogenase E2 component (dihydrolipoyl transacylase)
MSEFTFKLPDLGEGTVEAEIAEWMVKVGDVVAEEDPICAMLTDKAAVELTAPVSGRVTAVAGVEGDMVTVGAPLIVFETDARAKAPQHPRRRPKQRLGHRRQRARPHITPLARHRSHRDAGRSDLASIRARGPAKPASTTSGLWQAAAAS